MLLLGEHYEASQLVQLGLAWKAVPQEQLEGEALALARRLAALPPLAVRAMKRTLNATGASDLHRALQLETDATVAGFLDPETTRRLKDF